MNVIKKSLLKLTLLVLLFSWMSQNAAHIHGIDLDHDAHCKMGLIHKSSDHFDHTVSQEPMPLHDHFEAFRFEDHTTFVSFLIPLQQRAPPRFFA